MIDIGTQASCDSRVLPGSDEILSTIILAISVEVNPFAMPFFHFTGLLLPTGSLLELVPAHCDSLPGQACST